MCFFGVLAWAARASSDITVFVRAIMPVVSREKNFEGIRFFVPHLQWVTSDLSSIDTEFCDVFASFRENIMISGHSPDVEMLFPLGYGDQISSVEVLVPGF